jgi:glycosyltransferase 2 family protein
MSEKKEKSGVRKVAWIAGFVLLAVLVYVAARQSDPKKFLEIASHASPGWLGVAVALQVGTYLCAAAVLYLGLARGRRAKHVRYPKLVPLGLMKIFVDQALPTAGTGGTILVVRAMEKQGATARSATRAVVAGLFGFYFAYALAVAVSLTALWMSGHLNHTVKILASLVGLVLLGLPAILVWLAHVSEVPPGWLRKLPFVGARAQMIGKAAAEAMKDRALLAGDTGFQLAIFVLDSATLYAILHALGRSPSAVRVFASFIMASVAATLSVLPGGVGIFEAGSILMLRLMGEGLEVAFAATILFRGLSLWLPMLPGSILARRVMS